MKEHGDNNFIISCEPGGVTACVHVYVLLVFNMPFHRHSLPKQCVCGVTNVLSPSLHSLTLKVPKPVLLVER